MFEDFEFYGNINYKLYDTENLEDWSLTALDFFPAKLEVYSAHKCCNAKQLALYVKHLVAR